MGNTQLVTAPWKTGATGLKKKGVQRSWKECRKRHTEPNFSQQHSCSSAVNGQKRVEVVNLREILLLHHKIKLFITNYGMRIINSCAGVCRSKGRRRMSWQWTSISRLPTFSYAINRGWQSQWFSLSLPRISEHLYIIQRNPYDPVKPLQRQELWVYVWKEAAGAKTEVTETHWNTLVWKTGVC